MNIKQKGKNKKSAQEIQDDIFRKMSADKKLKVAAGLWLLAKDLAGEKINYGTNRPTTSVGKSR